MLAKSLSSRPHPPRRSVPPRPLDLEVSLMRHIFGWVSKQDLLTSCSVLNRELRMASSELVREVMLGRAGGRHTLCNARAQPARLAAVVQRFRSLTRLDLGGCRLTALPDALWTLGSITALRLSMNDLTSLPVAVTRLSKLAVLRLSDNKITDLPSELFTDCADLTMLLVDGNNLTTLPAAIGNARRKLTLLHVERNQIVEVPESIGRLERLTDLYLGENKIVKLPSSIGMLQKLERMSVYGNFAMKTLPLEITALRQLKNLDLPNNKEGTGVSTFTGAVAAWLSKIQTDGCCVH